MPRRGRPRRFDACPVCGAEDLRVYKTEQAGHCRNIYCECSACGARVRYVSAGTAARWIRVRDWPGASGPPPC